MIVSSVTPSFTCEFSEPQNLRIALYRNRCFHLWCLYRPGTCESSTFIQGCASVPFPLLRIFAPASPSKKAHLIIHVRTNSRRRLFDWPKPYLAAGEEVGMVAAFAQLHEKALQLLPPRVPALPSGSSTLCPHGERLGLARADQKPDTKQQKASENAKYLHRLRADSLHRAERAPSRCAPSPCRKPALASCARIW